MGLPLHDVHPRQGWRWILQALALWRRRPVGFVGLLLSFMLGSLGLAGMVPGLGGLIVVTLWPMLSLGFMIAARSALADGPLHVLQFFEGLRHPDRARRRAQWWVCLAFTVVSVAVWFIWSVVDGGTLQALMKAMSEAASEQRNAEINALLADRQLSAGILVAAVLSGITAVPFWYASALVHWGGQGAVQALFSSTVALWRARGAFLVYSLGWLLLGMVPLGLLLQLALLLLPPVLAGTLAMAGTLVFWVVFYLSLWFGYVDSFGAPEALAPALPESRQA